jgi:hypothetical protein
MSSTPDTQDRERETTALLISNILSVPSTRCITKEKREKNRRMEHKELSQK